MHAEALEKEKKLNFSILGIEIKKRMQATELVELKARLENETRLRLDFEMKVNGLNNANKKLLNHQDIQRNSIGNLQNVNKDKDIRLKEYEVQLLELTAYQHQAQLDIPMLQEDNKALTIRYDECFKKMQTNQEAKIEMQN